MSFEEKRTWIYAAIAVAIPAVYLAHVLGQVPGTPVTEIAYAGPMFLAIGVAILTSIAADFLTALVSPKTANKKDERDKQIARLGLTVGFFVFSILVLVPFGLALAEIAHFWIANAIYLAFTLTAAIYSIVKIVAYRRGF